MILADTDFLIDVMGARLRFHASAAAKAAELDADGRAVFMSAITRFELFAGSELYVEPATERTRIQSVLDRYASLPLTPEAADRAGKISGSLARARDPIAVADALIAATALEHDLPLLTRNWKHFSKVQGLKTETY